MQELTESVYECTLTVEAHMICDLLARAGISARVDGAFLSGAGGELPLGNTVKVRVEPARAIEAREVIADWEKLQPPDAAATVVQPPRFKSQLWFMVGALAGVTLGLLIFNTPYTNSGIDYDGDGANEVTWYFWGSKPSLTEWDRNGDRKADARWNFDIHGRETSFEGDDDFDGRFEWYATMENGQIVRQLLDADRDGRPEQVWHFEHGVLARIDYHFASGGRIVKREFYKSGLLDAAEFDDDRDGTFERRVRYDRFAEIAL